MTNKILLAMFILTALQAGARRGDTLNSHTMGAVNLAVIVQSVGTGADGTTASYENITHVLRYSEKADYFWYALRKEWAAGQQYRLLFKKLPSSGFLYVFTVDGINTPKIYRVLNLDSMHSAGGAGPDTLQTPGLAYKGQERLCLWYAKNGIETYEQVIMGIEMTHGDFSARVNGELGASLLLPGPGWYFTKKNIGFVVRNGRRSIPDTAVLPVIIQFEVK